MPRAPTSATSQLPARVRAARRPAELQGIALDPSLALADRYAALAEHGRALDAGLILMLLASEHPDAILLLLRNPHRPSETEDLVAAWMFGLLQPERDGARRGREDRLILDRRLHWAEQALLQIVRATPERLPAEGVVMRGLHALAFPRPRQAAHPERARVAQCLLVAHPEVSAEVVDAIAQASVRESLDAQSWVLRDPRVRPGTIQRVLAQGGSSSRPADLYALTLLLETWARRADVRADPALGALRALLVTRAFAVGADRVVQDLLVEETDPTVWAALLASPVRELRLRVLALRGAAAPRSTVDASLDTGPPPTPRGASRRP